MAAPSNPLESDGLCLLSIDGGGVRGLASLYILKYVMDRLNNVLHEPGDHDQRRLKPCDVFDLIGGTSTGGYHSFFFSSDTLRLRSVSLLSRGVFGAFK